MRMRARGKSGTVTRELGQQLSDVINELEEWRLM